MELEASINVSSGHGVDSGSTCERIFRWEVMKNTKAYGILLILIMVITLLLTGAILKRSECSDKNGRLYKPVWGSGLICVVDGRVE